MISRHERESRGQIIDLSSAIQAQTSASCSRALAGPGQAISPWLGIEARDPSHFVRDHRLIRLGSRWRGQSSRGARSRGGRTVIGMARDAASRAKMPAAGNADERPEPSRVRDGFMPSSS